MREGERYREREGEGVRERERERESVREGERYREREREREIEKRVREKKERNGGGRYACLHTTPVILSKDSGSYTVRDKDEVNPAIKLAFAV